MRNTILNTIHEAARTNPNIVFITGDLGYSVVEQFQKELPNQFINTGISEQNMIGVAAGLALAGKKVFVYTIVPFATMRCFEQIRVDVCYQNLDVTIIGVGGGYAYGTLGTTHYGLEDLALMRILPNMKVVAPSGPKESSILFKQIMQQAGPWYVRLNRGGEKDLSEALDPLVIGKGACLKTGNDATIFSIGAITEVALAAAALLEAKGLQVEVLHLHTLKPLDTALILDRVKNRRAIVTLEEHMITGALGSAVAEVMSESGLAVPFKRLGVQDTYLHVIGKQDYMRAAAGLSAEAVAATVEGLCQK